MKSMTPSSQGGERGFINLITVHFRFINSQWKTKKGRACQVSCTSFISPRVKLGGDMQIEHEKTGRRDAACSSAPALGCGDRDESAP